MNESGTRSHSLPPDLIQAVSEDAETLALLHDRELTPEFLGALKELDFPRNMGLLPSDGPTEKIRNMMAEAVGQLPGEPNADQMDDLAADYAAIYLTGAYGASPCESAWVSDDRLVCQESMFELREIYGSAGLKTLNWRYRPEDHLVLQLLYIAHAVGEAGTDEDWNALAKVLDEHLLRWLPDFSKRVASRSAQAFYAALAMLTDSWCSQLRDLIAAHLEQPRPTLQEIEERLHRSRPPMPPPCMPERNRN